MIVDIQRADLINLCRAITINLGGNLIGNPYKDTFLERRDFVNGFFWKLKADVIESATDDELLKFYTYHQPGIVKVDSNIELKTSQKTLF